MHNFPCYSQSIKLKINRNRTFSYILYYTTKVRMLTLNNYNYKKNAAIYLIQERRKIKFTFYPLEENETPGVELENAHSPYPHLFND